MEKEIAKGLFAEHAKVHDNYYGTSLAEIEKAKENGVPILEIDVQGARQISVNHASINALFVFVKPPSIEALRERLVSRSTETAEVIEKRVRNAKGEIDAASESFWDHVFVNDELDKCFEQICEFLETKLERIEKTKIEENVELGL